MVNLSDAFRCGTIRRVKWLVVIAGILWPWAGVSHVAAPASRPDLATLAVQLRDLPAGFHIQAAVHDAAGLQPGNRYGAGAHHFQVTLNKPSRDIVRTVQCDIYWWSDQEGAAGALSVLMRQSFASEVYMQPQTVSGLGAIGLVFTEDEGGPGNSWAVFRRKNYVVRIGLSPAATTQTIALARAVDNRIRLHG